MEIGASSDLELGELKWQLRNLCHPCRPIEERPWRLLLVRPLVGGEKYRFTRVEHLQAADGRHFDVVWAWSRQIVQWFTWSMFAINVKYVDE